MIRIVTDTTAGIPTDWAEKHRVPVIPQIIHFGEQTFLDVVEIDNATFLDKLRTSPILPKTAAPFPAAFVQAYQQLFAEGTKTILSIHPSTDVSGTCRSALTAVAEFPNADIRVIDTRTISGPLASLVIMATQWAEQGVSADEIEARVNALIPRGRALFLVDTLEYLKRGGRIGGATAFLGSLLDMKPILTLRAGRVEALERARTKTRALARIKELVLESCPRSSDAWLCVLQSAALTDAEKLSGDFASAFGFATVPIYELGPAIVTHAGPGTIGVGFFAGG